MKTADYAAESLEARRLMAAAALVTTVVPYAGGSMLKISGTSGNDAITLSYDGSVLRLKTAAGFSRSLSPIVSAIKINAGKGNDRVTVDATVWTPVFIHGEDGNDTLTGGSGDDYLYSGAGTNYLYGQKGRDTLISLGNAADDGLNGGAGDDAFWVDSRSSEKIYDATTYETANSVNRVNAFQQSKFTSGTKTESIPLALAGQRLRDPIADNAAYVYKPFVDRPLFSKTGPAADDVKQGQVGDCYFLSTLAGTAAVSPNAIRNMMTDLGDGTYAVRFKSGTGASQFYRVDNDLAVFSKASSTPAYAALGTQGSLWVAIAEKAFTHARKQQGSYGSIASGWMGEALTALGAKNQQTEWNDDFGNADDFMDFVEGRLKAGDVVTLAIYETNDALNLVGSHAYTVTRIDTMPDGSRRLVIRNPWGLDGYRTTDGNSDGYVTLTSQQAFSGIDAFCSGRAA